MRLLVLFVLVAVLAAGCTLPLPRPAEPPLYPEEVLAGDAFTHLVVEVDHAPGRAPSEAATTHLVMTLQNVTRKQDVRLVVQESLPDEPERSWTGGELVALERETRSTRHEAPTAVLHVLYVAGELGNATAAGVTVTGPRPPPVVIFLDTIRSIETDLGPVPLVAPAAEIIERSTLLHEAGHALGLVATGIPQVNDREDPEHPGHSTNEDSVMYWKVESLNGLREMLLSDGTVPDTFDANDRADLRAAGGR